MAGRVQKSKASFGSSTFFKKLNFNFSENSLDHLQKPALLKESLLRSAGSLAIKTVQICLFRYTVLRVVLIRVDTACLL